jgi:hypothetical protein
MIGIRHLVFASHSLNHWPLVNQYTCLIGFNSKTLFNRAFLGIYEGFYWLATFQILGGRMEKIEIWSSSKPQALDAIPQ